MASTTSSYMASQPVLLKFHVPVVLTTCDEVENVLGLGVQLLLALALRLEHVLLAALQSSWAILKCAFL